MARQTYLDFINLFVEISPFELGHLSESVFNKLDELYSDINGNVGKMPFSLQDTEFALIRAMRTVQIELAEAEAKAQVERVRALTFAPLRIAE